MVKLNFKQYDSRAMLPTCKHDSDAGRDIYSIEDVILQPGKVTVVSTGITLEMEWAFSPFKIADNLPVLLFKEQAEFANDYTYYNQQWIKQNYKFLFQIESRSGLASKGIHATGGIVDEDYRGEIKIILANTGKASYHVKEGDRIAQGVVKLIPKITEITWVHKFDETERGENGFGSSGK